MVDLLSHNDVQQYREQGYVVAPSVFDAAALAQVDQTIREITDAALATDDFSGILELEPGECDGQVVPRRIYNPFHIHGEFRKLATDPRVLRGVEQLIGPDLQMQHSKLNMKPPHIGSVVEWHQDLSYFPHTNDDLVTLLIYLDDASKENGCLQVIPKQHHGYLRHATEDGYFAGMVTEPVTKEKFGEPVFLEAPAGSVIFMHCLTPHSSLPNRSDKGRRTLIFEYRAADAFPIYIGPQTLRNEEHVVHLCGKHPDFARFGNVAPLIPKMAQTVTSLYDLQNQTRENNTAIKSLAANG